MTRARLSREGVAALAAAGLSDREIAEHFGVTQSGIRQARARWGIKSIWVRPPWQHGTRTGYVHHGCRCDECNAANTVVCVAYQHSSGRLVSYYQPCPACGKRIRVIDGNAWTSQYPHVCRGAS